MALFAAASACSVAVMTERTKVALIHAKVLMVLDLEDVMRLCCWPCDATLQAIHAEWIGGQVADTKALPCTVISAFVRREATLLPLPCCHLAH